MNQTIKASAASSAFRAIVSTALASAAVTGIDEARQNDRPLTQRQEIDVVKMAMMSYADAVQAFDRDVETEATLAALVDAAAGPESRRADS